MVDTEFTNNRLGDVDTAIFDSDTLVMPRLAQDPGRLRREARLARVNYGIASYSTSATVDEDGFGANGGRRAA